MNSLRSNALVLMIALLGASIGASCSKQSSGPSGSVGDGENKAIAAALDRATQDKEAAAAKEGSAPAKELEGVDLSKLSNSNVKLFKKLTRSLVSPCGKTESLYKSAISRDCKRSAFAVRYVAQLLSDGAPEEQAREYYGRRYVDNKLQKFDISAAVPHVGPVDAPVVIVEFADYGCPHCKLVAPIVAQVIKANGANVVVYHKQFPLGGHTHSKGAAQAALAANKQGKFVEMHELLFAKQGAHETDKLMGYAASLGLDMARFKTDFEAALATVEADKKEGDAAGVQGTPSFFVNGRTYEDPTDLRYFNSWIEEELAVNR